MTTDDRVRLRPVQPGDLPRIFDLQLDPDSNRMAVTIPRTAEAFDSHWAKALGDPKNTTRAILFDGEMVGYISCFPMDGQPRPAHSDTIRRASRMRWDARH